MAPNVPVPADVVVMVAVAGTLLAWWGSGFLSSLPLGTDLPIRLDFSYNLNPPIYPVTYDPVKKINLVQPYVGEGSHFNFFFSLGQSF